MPRPEAVGGAYGLCPRWWAGLIGFAGGDERGLLTMPEAMGGASVRPRDFIFLNTRLRFSMFNKLIYSLH